MIVPHPPSGVDPEAVSSLAAAEEIVFGPRGRGPGSAGIPISSPELSHRERQILQMASRGLSNADVAGELGLSIETVKSHMRRVLGKLGARNRCHAVALGYETGVLRPGGEPEPPPTDAITAIEDILMLADDEAVRD